MDYAGQNISVCPLSVNASSGGSGDDSLVVTDTITISGMLAAARVIFPPSKGGGSVQIASVGNYASANGLDPSKGYNCTERTTYHTGIVLTREDC